MAKYSNPEMRKSMQQMKEKPRRMKVTDVRVSTREPLATSSKRAGSMTKSGLPRNSSPVVAVAKNATKMSKKPVSQSPMGTRATKRGTPVAMPSKPGNIATGSKKTARPVPTGKAKKKTVVTPRKRLDPSKMTPAQKKAYYDQPGYDNY